MSNLKTVEEEIDGIKFSTTPLDAFRSLEMMGKLAQTIGPAFGALSNMEVGDGELDKMAPILGAALRDLKPSELGPLALEILVQTTATIEVDGTLKRIDILDKGAFNKVFSGKLLTMFKALAHVLKVNYADFGLGSASSETSAP